MRTLLELLEKMIGSLFQGFPSDAIFPEKKASPFERFKKWKKKIYERLDTLGEMK